MSASSGANFEASARQVARYRPKPTFGERGNCPAALSVATALTSKIVYLDGSQTLRIALAIGSPTPCSEVTTVRRSSGASNARRVTSSTRSGGLLRSLDLARGDFHSPTARSSSLVRYPRRLACAPTSAKSQASVAASRSVCSSTYARLHRRTNARSILGEAIRLPVSALRLVLGTRRTTAPLARRLSSRRLSTGCLPTGCLRTGRLPTRRLPIGRGCRSVQRSLSTALHRMGARCEFPEVPITQVQLETPTTELESDRLRSWPSIPSIAHDDHCFHGSPLVDVPPIDVRREPRGQYLEAHLGVQTSWPSSERGVSESRVATPNHRKAHSAPQAPPVLRPTARRVRAPRSSPVMSEVRSRPGRVWPWPRGSCHRIAHRWSGSGQALLPPARLEAQAPALSPSHAHGDSVHAWLLPSRPSLSRCQA